MEELECRRLLAVAINEFGGSATLFNPIGITKGPDGNLWFTQTGNQNNPTGAIGRITPSGAITQYTNNLSLGAAPTGITVGPDGALWFTEFGVPGIPGTGDKIGRIDLDGNITEYAIPNGLIQDFQPNNIVTGPDNNLWFTEFESGRIGRITAQGDFLAPITIPTPNSEPVGITVGPDNALWFAESNTDKIGRVDLQGNVTEFPVPGVSSISADSGPTGITLGPDNNLWFTEFGTANNPLGGIGRITPQGIVTEFTAGLTPGSGPSGIVSGADGNLYFTEATTGRIGQVTTAGVITELTLSNPVPQPTNPQFPLLAAITLGPDNNLWTPSTQDNLVVRATTTGTSTLFPSTNTLPVAASPHSLTTGIDGSIFFTEPGVNGIGQITTSGIVSQVTASGISPNAGLGDITTRPDGALFFVEQTARKVGMLSTDGTVKEYAISQKIGPTGAASIPGSITSSPDGTIWFTINVTVSGRASSEPRLGRISPQGTLTEIEDSAFEDGTSLEGITVGPDNAIYFGVNDRSFQAGIFRIDPTTEQITAVTTSLNAIITDITSGQDGALYVTNSLDDQILRVTLSGTVSPFTIPNPTNIDGLQPDGIISGPDGAIYFVETIGNQVVRLNSDGSFTEFPIPTSSSFPRSLAVGGDNNLYFSESFAEIGSSSGNSQIGQVILPQTSVVASASPPLVLNPDQPLRGPLVTFTDRSPAATAANFEATIDFGDGTTGVGVIQAAANGSFTINGPHSYSQPGDYVIVVTISNPTGQSTPLAIPVAVQQSFVVTNTNDSGRGSLRQAIINANRAGGQRITFAIPSNLANSSGIFSIAPLTPLPEIGRQTFVDGESQAIFVKADGSPILIQIDGRNTPASQGLVFAQGSDGSTLQGISIFGFLGNQVELNSNNDVVRNNYVGFAADPTITTYANAGANPAGGLGADGILVRGLGALIGGITTADRNVISGNLGQGVEFNGQSATNGLILNNYIGLDPSGSRAIPNVLNGVLFVNGARGIHTLQNVISGNLRNGMRLLATSDAGIYGNLIGTDASGRSALGNGEAGISLEDGSLGVVVGAPAPAATNVISGNKVVGIAIQSGSSGNAVTHNLVGTDITGTVALGNGIGGILISNGSGNIIGPANVVSGNGAEMPGAGIWVDGPNAANNVVSGNFVGTDRFGVSAVPNTSVGILVNGGTLNVVDLNVVSGNTAIGVMLASSATNNTVMRNRIGTDFTGTVAIGNGGATTGVGLYVLDSSNNLIGGPSIAEANVISGNNFDGVEFFSTDSQAQATRISSRATDGGDTIGASTSGNVFQYNLVGTDITGTRPLGNANDGVVLDRVGSNQILSNYISANGRNGIFISASAEPVIRGNAIGLGVGGQTLGNRTFGILIGNGSAPTISPATLEATNLILNNGLAPTRDTDINPAVVISVPSEVQGNSARKSRANKAKHRVKVQTTGHSMKNRPASTLQARHHAKAKARARAKP